MIDSKILERDFSEKPVPTFSHPALKDRKTLAEGQGVQFQLTQLFSSALGALGKAGWEARAPAEARLFWT